MKKLEKRCGKGSGHSLSHVEKAPFVPVHVLLRREKRVYDVIRMAKRKEGVHG